MQALSVLVIVAASLAGRCVIALVRHRRYGGRHQQRLHDVRAPAGDRVHQAFRLQDGDGLADRLDR